MGEQPSTAPSRDIRAIAFAITFVFLALSLVMLTMTPAVEKAVVTPFTGFLVAVSSALINLFGAHVAANGAILAFIGAPGAVEVANGCNAVEVSILLASAIIAWPAGVRARIVGVIACVLSVQTINLGRIISLLFLSRYAPHLFEFFHLYVWEAMIMLEAVLVFFIWMRRHGGVAQPVATSS